MKAIAYNTADKTFAVVSTELAKAMLYTGNPHGFNRAVEFPDSGESFMRERMKANKYTEI